jgi:hypothetical protein
MRAWGLLSTALGSARRVPSSAALRLQPWLEFITVDLGDVAVLGASARQLGRGLLPASNLAPARGGVTEALERRRRRDHHPRGTRRGVRPPARLGARRASADRREVHARWSAGAGAVPGGAPGLDDAC